MSRADEIRRVRKEAVDRMAMLVTGKTDVAFLTSADRSRALLLLIGGKS